MDAEKKETPVCETEAGGTLETSETVSTPTDAGAQEAIKQTSAPSRIGYVQLMRTPDTFEFIRTDHTGFILAAVIGLRARRTGSLAFDGLEIGEALLGDFEAYGMSREQYRSACRRLARIGFATFRTTTKGTVAKLINTDVFDPNLEVGNQRNNQQANQRATNRAPTRHQRGTTNKKGNPSKRGVPPSYKKEKLLENASDVLPVVDSGEPPATSSDFWEGC
jgi:hypothetical protein